LEGHSIAAACERRRYPSRRRSAVASSAPRGAIDNGVPRPKKRCMLAQH